MSSQDLGVANERTALAWQRTALTLVAGTAAMARLTVARAGTPILFLLAVSALLGTWVFVESAARYRHSAGHRARPRGRGGRAAMVLAVATALLCVGELAALLPEATG